MAEVDTADALESEIEAAQQAGDHERANALYRRQQGVEVAEQALVAGDEGVDPDHTEGDEGLAETSTPPPISAELADQLLEVYSEYEADEVAELRREWHGTEMTANFGYIKWFLDEYVPPHLIEEVPDNIALLRLGAAVGRELFHRHHADAGERSEGARNMHEIDASNFDEKTDDLMTAADAARAAGNLAKADRLEREIRALFVKRYGTGPAVGSSGGPTV